MWASIHEYKFISKLTEFSLPAINRLSYSIHRSTKLRNYLSRFLHPGLADCASNNRVPVIRMKLLAGDLVFQMLLRPVSAISCNVFGGVSNVTVGGENFRSVVLLEVTV